MTNSRTRRSGSTSAAAIDRAERERQAIALRRDGHTYDEIATIVGYSNKGAAYKAVKRGLSRWMREADEDLRAIELARTDLVISRLMPLVDTDDPDQAAITSLLRVMDYRAKITGLYAPQQHHVGIDLRTRLDVSKVEAFELWEATVAQATAAHIGSAELPPPADEPDGAPEGGGRDD